MPTSVGILTAPFSSPLPYPGHLFLRPHHLLKPSTLFYGNLLKPLTLSKLLPQPSHFYRNPKVCWRLLPHLTSSPTLEEGGKVSSSWLPANSVSIVHHRLSHFSLENPISRDDPSVFSSGAMAYSSIHCSSLVWGCHPGSAFLPPPHPLPAPELLGPPHSCLINDMISAPVITSPWCLLSSNGMATPQMMPLPRLAPPWKKQIWNSLPW